MEKIPSLGNYTLAKEEQDSSRFEINFIFFPQKELLYFCTNIPQY